MQSVSPVPPDYLGDVAEHSIEDMYHILFGSERGAVVLSGAGISTSSGIPDYRSPNRPAYKPLQNGDFFRKDSVRRRYWARSSLGYRRLSAARPNGTHYLIAALEAAGRVSSVITQNVDRLHQRAGSRRVLELHGTVHEVACMDCGVVISRMELQRRMERENGGWQKAFAGQQEARPDGDVELPDRAYETFVMPSCGGQTPRAGALRSLADSASGIRDSAPGSGSAAPSQAIVKQSAISTPPQGSSGPCRGFLKPSVVFFGGSVPGRVSSAATDLVDGADGMLVLGSTLAVHSSLRLARAAALQGKPVGVVTFGDTRADGLQEQVGGTARVSKAVASASAVLEQLLLLGLERGDDGAQSAMGWLAEHSRPDMHPILARSEAGVASWGIDPVDPNPGISEPASRGDSPVRAAQSTAAQPDEVQGVSAEEAQEAARRAAMAIRDHGPVSPLPLAPPHEDTDPAVLRGLGSALPDDDPPPVPHLQMRKYLPWCA